MFYIIEFFIYALIKILNKLSIIIWKTNIIIYEVTDIKYNEQQESIIGNMLEDTNLIYTDTVQYGVTTPYECISKKTAKQLCDYAFGKYKVILTQQQADKKMVLFTKEDIHIIRSVQKNYNYTIKHVNSKKYQDISLASKIEEWVKLTNATLVTPDEFIEGKSYIVQI